MEDFCLGDDIKSLREIRGLSQEDLAKATGISLRSIKNYESNKVKPRPKTITKLLEVLNIEDLDENELNEENEIDEIDSLEEVNEVDSLEEVHTENVLIIGKSNTNNHDNHSSNANYGNNGSNANLYGNHSSNGNHDNNVNYDNNGNHANHCNHDNYYDNYFIFNSSSFSLLCREFSDCTSNLLNELSVHNFNNENSLQLSSNLNHFCKCLNHLFRSSCISPRGFDEQLIAYTMKLELGNIISKFNSLRMIDASLFGVPSNNHRVISFRLNIRECINDLKFIFQYINDYFKLNSGTNYILENSDGTVYTIHEIMKKR